MNRPLTAVEQAQLDLHREYAAFAASVVSPYGCGNPALEHWEEIIEREWRARLTTRLLLAFVRWAGRCALARAFAHWKALERHAMWREAYGSIAQRNEWYRPTLIDLVDPRGLRRFEQATRCAELINVGFPEAPLRSQSLAVQPALQQSDAPHLAPLQNSAGPREDEQK